MFIAALLIIVKNWTQQLENYQINYGKYYKTYKRVNHCNLEHYG